MSRKHAVLIVEGPTDQAVVARALRLLGFKSFEGKITELESFWRHDVNIVPKYPAGSGKLYERLQIPSILSTDTYSIAVYSGSGSMLVKQIEALFENHDLHEVLDAFGVVVDADKKQPAEVAVRYQKDFQKLFPNFPGKPGEVLVGPPALGVFVLPDNVHPGVVEHLVLECGDHVYAEHVERARRYVGDFGEGERKLSKWGPFDEQKAVVASVASLLKPGKTNTVTLADNEWIGKKTEHLPQLAELLRFLRELVPAEIADVEQS